MLRILHISDVHFSTGKLKDFQFVRDALIEDLKTNLPADGVDLAVFSGDLVHAGGVDDDFYSAHAELIAPVLQVLNLPSGRFFIVPGNHDIDRNEVRDDQINEQGQFSLLSNRENLNAFIDQQLRSDRDIHQFRRLKNYFEFRQLCMDAPSIRETRFFTTHRLEVRGATIGIACFNTAWRATGEENRDYGRLLLGERSVSDAVSDLVDCDTRIAILHHPLSWLREFDREDCRPLLLRDFDLLLTGHLHQQNLEQVTTPMGRAVISEAGALYYSRRWFNGYCFIELNKSQGDCGFTIRRYEDSQKKFDVATNVASNGRYVVSLRGSTDIARYVSIETVLQTLRPVWDELMREQLAAGSPDTEGLSLDELYVPATLSEKTDSSITKSRIAVEDSPANETKFASEQDVIKVDKPVIIYGGNEFGKTSVGFQLGRLVASAHGKDLKVPVYLDLSLLKPGANNIQRAIRDFVSKAAVPFDCANNINGSFFIVIDNFEKIERDASVRGRKIKMVEDFIAQHPKNSYVLLADYDEAAALRVTSRPAYRFDHEKFYLQPLSRKKIKDLAAVRLRGSATRKTVDAILARLDQASLPKTPYVVSLVLSAYTKDQGVGPINEATLLERFVESLLNRSSPSEVERAVIDYKLKEAFLAHLAHFIAVNQRDNYVAKNDLVKFTIDFFKARSWSFDAMQFVEGLIDNGVLYQGEVEDEVMVAFRYGWIRQYFTAKYFHLDRSFLSQLLKDGGYEKYLREIDLFTALTRNERELLEFLLERVSTLALSVGVRDEITTFKLAFKYSRPQEISGDLTVDVQSYNSTDEDVDQLLDMLERSGGIPVSRPEISSNKDVPDDDEGNSDLLSYFSNLTLLSTTVRNCELSDDAELKLRAIDQAIDGWTFLASHGARSFDRMIEGKGKSSDLAEFAKMSTEALKGFEVFVKCGLTVMAGHFAAVTLATDKLRSLIAKCLDETPQDETLRRILLFFMLIDLAFAHGDQPQAQALKLFDRIIADNKNDLAILTLVFAKLHQLYFQPYIGNENRQKLEQLMVDIHLRIHGTKPMQKGVVGSLQDRFIKHLKGMREAQLKREGNA